jgi:hypothetical protein
MSQYTQNPYFWTLDGSLAQSLEVVGATSVSIDTDNTLVTNTSTFQQIVIPLGTTLDLNPDSGNTLATLEIVPQGANLAYVVMIGGTAQLI